METSPGLLNRKELDMSKEFNEKCQLKVFMFSQEKMHFVRQAFAMTMTTVGGHIIKNMLRHVLL